MGFKGSTREIISDLSDSTKWTDWLNTIKSLISYLGFKLMK